MSLRDPYLSTVCSKSDSKLKFTPAKNHTNTIRNPGSFYDNKVCKTLVLKDIKIQYMVMTLSIRDSGIHRVIYEWMNMIIVLESSKTMITKVKDNKQRFIARSTDDG